MFMASARIHEAIALEVNKDYNLDELLLRIGTVAPDSWRSASPEVKDKYLSHFWNFRIKKGEAYDYKEFYLKYFHQLQNPVYFGYLIHLMADQYWKTYIDPLYKINQNGKIGYRLKDGSFCIDHNRFRHNEGIKLQKQLASVYQLGALPHSLLDLPNFHFAIDELNLNGLWGTLNYINTNLMPSETKENLQIYDLNDIIKKIHLASDFIKQELKSLEQYRMNLSETLKIAINIDFLNYFEDAHDFADCLDELLKKGYFVTFLTSKPITLKRSLMTFLEAKKLHYHYLCFSGIEDYLNEYHFDVLIDNNLRNITNATKEEIKTMYLGSSTFHWQDVAPYLETLDKQNNVLKRKIV